MQQTAKSIFAAFLLLLSLNIQASDSYRKWFSFLSPLPGAHFVMPEQKITFRLNAAITDVEDLLDTEVSLTGTVSGPISGTIKLASDRQTLIFSPAQAFAHGEMVSVSIRLAESLNIPEFSADFTITTLPAGERRKALEEIRQQEMVESGHVLAVPAPTKSLFTTNDSLPEGFPEISIVKWDQPSAGYIFVSPLNYDEDIFFQIILDNYATPVYYREVPPNGTTDFKLQPNGCLTSFLDSESKFIVQDSRFNVIDTIAAQNGYHADLHELRYDEDMHSFFLCYDPQLVDMSLVAPGGQPDAVVIGLIVQELDENKDLVFQWRSWDHYEITDASNWIDLTANTIDYVHGNSIEIVNDSVMMISSRNMNEITRIDRNTGDILWRLNGEKNMFEFIPPADSFCMQHAIRLMPDSSNISLFDNGNCWGPPYSSAVEYILDEENFTATLVERLRSDPDIYGPFMGNTQRLFNGHAINGWGKGVPSVTEFDASGNIVLEFSFPQLNYRAFKFDWQHEVFYADVEAIDFGTIDYHAPVSTTFTLMNNQPTAIEINRVVNQTGVFSVENPLPILLPQGGSATVEVKFDPATAGSFEDILTLCWEVNSDTLRQRVAVQVELTGTATGDDGVNELEAAGFRVFPSPFEKMLSIRSEKHGIASIRILNMHGKEVFRKQLPQRSMSFDQRLSLPAGIYLLVIETEDGEIFSGKIVRK